jgi:hypothetical protein
MNIIAIRQNLIDKNNCSEESILRHGNSGKPSFRYRCGVVCPLGLVWKMFDRRYYEKIDERRPLELHHFDTSDSRRWSVDRKLQSRYYCRIRNCDDLLDIFNVS